MSGIKAAVLAVCVLMAACAHNPAPKGVLPAADFLPQYPFGAWAEITMRTGGIQAGELLALSDDTIWIEQYGTKAIAQTDAVKMRVALFDAKMGKLQAWATLGAISTISNGWFLLFTFPMWLGGGGGTNIVASKQPLYEWRTGSAIVLYSKFARFPAGLPPDWK